MEQAYRPWLSASAACALLSMAACAPKADAKPPPDGPFAVSDYYAPSGAMGDGATPGNLVINQNAACKDRPPGARGNCFSFQYVDHAPYTTQVTMSTGVCDWAGVFWQYPANNWGTHDGLPVPTGKLTKVSFQVAVGQGMELMTFQIGGIGTPPQPDGAPGVSPSDACPPVETPPPPNYDQILGKLQLTIGTDWQKLSVPLAARDASMNVPQSTLLMGAFAWTVASNAMLPKTIYIDDLVYE
jgi:hypothetical protein